ncbi:hypothetical protein Zm00014a_018423 [Zea mays]|uniref:Uncharacterized protein n=1 Tax=Zea mays TaxID=4577 RepID=A0A3L6E6W8_MAIZE|nr:hypothetical protein Zm00014a_018423 [Zea mays]
MHRQLSLSASPKQQQPPPDGTSTGGGDAAAKAMAAAEDESSASHSSSKASRGWSARDERAIHLVPLLTFLCFLLLFLCSHDPSPADMSSFAGGGGGGGGGARSGNRRLRML